MLPKEFRLRTSRDIRKVYARRRSWANNLLVLHVRASRNEVARFAFVTSKKVGQSVVRNRVRRQLRASVASKLPAVTFGFDAVIIARSGCATATFYELKSAVDELLVKSGVVRNLESEG